MNKKKFQCSQCKKYFGTKGGIDRHNRPFPQEYRNKNRRPSKCEPNKPDSYKGD